MDLAHYFESMKGKGVLATPEETSRYLVFFKVDKILPLIGPGKEERGAVQ